MELFEGIKDNELVSLLGCLGYRIKAFKKNETIIEFDDKITEIGIVQSGIVQVAKLDCEGNKSILGEFGESETFAENIVFAQVEKSPVMVTCEKACKILFINFSKIANTCKNDCGFHKILIQNSMKLIAKKNIQLNFKIELLSQKSLREKIMFYLKGFGYKHGEEFEIPFNRNSLADYLRADRAALSRELSKMQKEGIIQYERNYFVLLAP